MKKNIKINTKESFHYEGLVKVDLLLGDKIVKTVYGHNEGRKPLFEFLALCIVNDFQNNLRPNFIRLFNSVNGVDTEVTNRAITHSGVEVTSGTDSETSEEWAAASLRFLIPYTALNVIGDKQVNKLKLYSPANYKNILNPSVEYDLSEPIPVPNNSIANIQITWKLEIKN